MGGGLFEPDDADRPTRLLGTGKPPLVSSWDHFSDDGARRFRLEYWWNHALPPLIVCGQNPSRASRKRGDHTVTVCARRAHSEGLGGLSMVNLFPEVATDPADLWAMDAALDEWEGPALDAVRNAVREHGGARFLFAPGCDANPRHRERAWKVEKMIRALDRPILCLGVTNAGLPRHPSRLGYDVRMTDWHGSYRS